LTVYDKDAETGVSTIRDIKEEDVFFGEIPLMTDNGTLLSTARARYRFAIHRSPGVFFKGDRDTYLAKIIPYRGSWVEFEYDAKNILCTRDSAKRKILATIFLRRFRLVAESANRYENRFR
jgi:DNA-directed RNA polymerase subunit beta